MEVIRNLQKLGQEMGSYLVAVGDVLMYGKVRKCMETDTQEEQEMTYTKLLEDSYADKN